MVFSVPVLLLAWRRSECLLQVIDAIRPVAPCRLYIACDGPNPDRPGEADKVAATRALIESQINWPCQIHCLFSETNQGCRLGVSRAISWFFGIVDEGIILEDDCVPHPDFFPYCAELLERFRNDTRVWCVSGSNFLKGRRRGEGSYYFSRYSHCWGWASWRRCWQHYDPDLSQWPSLRESGLLDVIFEDPLERSYWSNVWEGLAEAGRPDTWDYQWFFLCVVNNGLTAVPNSNLVMNIGVGEEATHTMTSGGALFLDPKPLGPITHPDFVLRDIDADQYIFSHHYPGAQLRYQQSLRGRYFDPFLTRIRTSFQSPGHYPSKLLRILLSGVIRRQ